MVEFARSFEKIGNEYILPEVNTRDGTGMSEADKKVHPVSTLASLMESLIEHKRWRMGLSKSSVSMDSRMVLIMVLVVLYAIAGEMVISKQVYQLY